MIKKEELMLGDLVLYRNEPCRVTILSENGSIGVTDKHDATTVVQGKDLGPIPVTPEILEKNGFERCEDSILYVWKLSNLQLGSISCFETANKTWNFDILGNYLSPIKVRGDFEYVHELQNILKMCGIDKNIKP